MSTESHRRDFAKGVAVTVAAGFPLTRVRADDPKPDDAKKSEPTKPSTEADARMQLIEARFGKYLDDNARREVRSEIEGQVKRAEALRKIEVDYREGPAPVFVPYRAPLGS